MSDVQPTVEYRDVPGFPGYRVGDDGSVWSAWTRAAPPGCGAIQSVIGDRWVRKKYRTNKAGYSRITLRSAAGKDTSQYVHRLVLAAFVGPCPEGMECLHGPGGPG